MKQIVLKVNDSFPIWFLEETENEKFDGRKLSDNEVFNLVNKHYEDIKDFNNVIEEHELFPILKQISEKFEFKSNGDVYACKFFIK